MTDPHAFMLGVAKQALGIDQPKPEPTIIDTIVDIARAGMGQPDPRDPRPAGTYSHPMFRDHNCSRCDSGAKPCPKGNPSRCDWPHARND
jgi:hypothetical protein